MLEFSKNYVTTTDKNRWSVGPMLNHAPFPYANTQIIGTLTKTGILHIVWAIKDIAEGDHLTWDYNLGNKSKSDHRYDTKGF